MTNPFHDQNGRFCSKGEMKAIVDQLGAAVANQQAGRGKALSNGERDAETLDQWIEMKSAYEKASASEAVDAEAFRAPAPKSQAIKPRFSHSELSEMMDFGRVIQVGKEGVPFPALNGLGLSTAPEEIQYVDLDADGGAPDPQAPKGWEYLKGFTGQYSYNGSVMHESEVMSGGLADHILDNPGFYTVVEIDAWPEDESEDAEPVGWGVLHYVGEQPVQAPAPKASLASEFDRIQREDTSRVASEFLNTELGDHFSKGWLELAADGQKFHLVVNEPFEYKNISYAKDDRVAFDSDGDIIGWAGNIDRGYSPLN